MDYLALDIGGTKIKYGIIDENGNIKQFYEKDTNAKRGEKFIIKNIKNIINSILENNNSIVAIGISTAGQVNSQKGEIIFATDNIPGWTGVRLKEIIEKEFKLPCKVENDVNCAALGELWLGSGRNKKNFLMITLGTGIGGAIVIDRKLFTGNNFLAGEFGHMTICNNGLKCTCGYNGCFEQYASTSALIKIARYKLNVNENYNISGELIFEKAKANNKLYIDILDEWIKNIALGIRNLVNIFNPGLIIIGGGVSKQGDFLTNLIKEHLKNILMPSFLEQLELKTAECANFAGVLGAVYNLK